MKLTLINPNIVSQKGDVAGTGIPYIPLSLVYLGAFLKSKEYAVQMIDSFSENPFHIVEKDGFLYQGLTPQEILAKIDHDSSAIILYAGQVYAHQSLLDIIDAIKVLPKEIIIIENTQAVTAYSLQHAYQDFFDHGIHYILSGEAEPRIESLIALLQHRSSPEKIDGLVYRDSDGTIHKNPKILIQDPNVLPFPDWDMIHIQNYWKIGYAHAPLTTGKYLPILTSRGCPLACAFCVVPATNKRRWRPRTPENVVAEIELNVKKYHVHEFHLEDLNPTVDKRRIVDICKLLIEKKIHVMLKFASGTKAETYDLDTIDWMGKAGFNYISISPESGSERVLKLMKKAFHHDEAVLQVKKMYELNITSQACIVLGFPGETKHDLQLTQKYVNKLARAGLDEVALFIMTPVPGSDVYDTVAPENISIAKLTFTPTWRKEYRQLKQWRTKIFISFMFYKTVFHPINTFKSFINIFSGNYRTKIEMTLGRILKTHFLFRKHKKKVVRR